MGDVALKYLLVAVGSALFAAAMLGESAGESVVAVVAGVLGMLLAAGVAALRAGRLAFTPAFALDAGLVALWSAVVAYMVTLWIGMLTGRLPRQPH